MPGPSSPRPGAGGMALVVASVLWGTTGTAATLLPGNVSPLATGAATMTVGGILLFAVSARGARGVLRHPEARRWVLIGASGVVVYPLAFYSAMNLAGVAIGNVVALGSGPLFAALLEWVIERHRPTRRWLAATATAIAGILLVGGSATGADARGAVIPGMLLGLLAGLAYALYTYASSRAIANGHAGRSAMGAMFGVGSLALAPVLAVTGAPLLQSAGTLAITGYLAVGPMFLAYLVFGAALRTVRSSAATTITLIEPLVATLLAVIVVGERLSLVGWIGLGLILTGVTITATARRVRDDLATA